MTHILLIQNLLMNERDRRWKFPAETIEQGEPVLNALVGGAKEEVGLDIPSGRSRHGEVLAVGDASIVINELRPKKWLETKRPHWQHFYSVRVSDETLEALSGKTLEADIDEKLLTQSFRIGDVLRMESFLHHQRELLREFTFLYDRF